MTRSMIAAVLAALAVPAAAQQASDVLVTVNDTKITRGEIIERLWRNHAAATVDALVKEELVRQAFKDEKIKADEKEIEKRLKALKDRFKDEAAFKESLERNRTTEQAIRGQIREQVMREDLVIKVKNIEVSSKEVKEFFDKNEDKLATQESVRLRHILVGTQQKADDLHLALTAGADFGVLARQASLDKATKERGGDMGYVTKGLLAPDIETVAWSLKKGEISKVLKTNLGFHILYVEDRRAAKPAEFKEIRDDLKAAMLADKVTNAWPKYLDELTQAAKITTPQPGAN